MQSKTAQCVQMPLAVSIAKQTETVQSATSGAFNSQSCQTAGSATTSARLGLPPHRYIWSHSAFPAWPSRAQGQYKSEEDFGRLNNRLDQLESKRKKADRIFYLSIPPAIFTDVAASAASAASSKCAASRPPSAPA